MAESGDPRLCLGCGEPLEPGRRPNAKHHNNNGACKQRAYRARVVAAQAAPSWGLEFLNLELLSDEARSVLRATERIAYDDDTEEAAAAKENLSLRDFHRSLKKLRRELAAMIPPESPSVRTAKLHS